MDNEFKNTNMVEDEDGGITFVSTRKKINPSDFTKHDANLADALDESDLQDIAMEIIDGIRADESSREEWVTRYNEAKQYLGLVKKTTSMPFEGSSTAIVGLMMTALTRAQATAIQELNPAGGPVKTQIIDPNPTPEMEAQADRVKNALNYYVTEELDYFAKEQEDNIWEASFGGTSYKRVYRCPLEKRPVSRFVPPMDLIISYMSSGNLKSCPRITHRQFMDSNDVTLLMLKEYYRDVSLIEPTPFVDDSKTTNDNISGRQPSQRQEDVQRTIYTTWYRLDLPNFEHRKKNGEPSGYKLPYLITIDRDSEKVLRIERNWEEPKDGQDLNYNPIVDIFPYTYMPGFGAYGMGLVNLLLPAQASCTSILRQLIDAGTLENLGGGFISSAIKFENSTMERNPGQFIKVNAMGQNLASNIVNYPSSPPSQALFNLLELIMTDAQTLAGTPDILTGDTAVNAPVGTIVAQIDQAMKLTSAVHKRFFDSLKLELRALAKLLSADPDQEWLYQTDKVFGSAKGSDFSNVVNIVPVADPNVPSQAQRVARATALMAMAQQAPPGIYDMREVNIRLLNVMNIPVGGLLLPEPPKAIPLDPITENQNALKNLPLMAGESQNHSAHIQVHMAMLQQPNVQGLPQVAAALQSHIADHANQLIRLQTIQAIGMELPPSPAVDSSGNPVSSKPLSQEQEDQIAIKAAAAVQQIMASVQQAMGNNGQNQAAQLAQQQAQIAQQGNQLKAQELQQKQQEAAIKAHDAAADNANEVNKLQMTIANDAAERQARQQSDQTHLQIEQQRAAQQATENNVKLQTARITAAQKPLNTKTNLS